MGDFELWLRVLAVHTGAESAHRISQRSLYPAKSDIRHGQTPSRVIPTLGRLFVSYKELAVFLRPYSVTRMSNPTSSTTDDDRQSVWTRYFGYLKDYGVLLPDFFDPALGSEMSEGPLNEISRLSAVTYTVDALLKTEGGLQQPVTVKYRNLTHQTELRVVEWFNNGAQKNSMRNHCVPLLKPILRPISDDGSAFMILPKLKRFDDPSFKTIGEVAEFVRQAFEGMQLLHEHQVLLSKGPSTIFLYYAEVNDKKRSNYLFRTRSLPTYYFADFDVSEMPSEESTEDPFNSDSDVRKLGVLVSTNFLEKFRGLSFMDGVVHEMLDPKTPMMQRVCEQFAPVYANLSESTRRSRLARKDEVLLCRVFRGLIHRLRS